jgi:ribonuclease HI
MDASTVIELLRNYIKTYTANYEKIEDVYKAQQALDQIITDPRLSDSSEFRETINSARLLVDCGWRPMTDETIRFFCDGSCKRNGKPNAVAGYGIYGTKGNRMFHKYSARVPEGDLQTNQRAELLALRYTLNYIVENNIRNAKIYSDSKYSIQCLTEWQAAWRRAGWKKADKKPISHIDILPTMCDVWNSLKTHTELIHVYGHTGGTDILSIGNSEADRLAQDAAV